MSWHIFEQLVAVAFLNGGGGGSSSGSLATRPFQTSLLQLLGDISVDALQSPAHACLLPPPPATTAASVALTEGAAGGQKKEEQKQKQKQKQEQKQNKTKAVADGNTYRLPPAFTPVLGCSPFLIESDALVVPLPTLDTEQHQAQPTHQRHRAPWAAAICMPKAEIK